MIEHANILNTQTNTHSNTHCQYLMPIIKPQKPRNTSRLDGIDSIKLPILSPIAGLYVIGTPIGNLQDISLRTLSLLACCDLVCCEDTRRTRNLLSHFAITNKQGKLIRYDDHANSDLRAKICERIENGQSVALLSDSGTPTLADPGMKLVRTCRENSLPVFAVPGPSALTAALSVCGLPSDRALFLGFLPHKTTHKQRLLQSLVGSDATLVFFETPHRLHPTLTLLSQLFAQQQACILREMTKVFETHHFGLIENLTAELAQKKPRGEYTILIAPAKNKKRRHADTQT